MNPLDDFLVPKPFPWPDGVETLTVILPADTKMPVITAIDDWEQDESGNIVLPASGGGLYWRRLDDGRIEAIFDREGMDLAYFVAQALGRDFFNL